MLKITQYKDNRGKENTWHSDVTWRQEPSRLSLENDRVPDYGGDTLCRYSTYEDLSDEVKEKLDGAVTSMISPTSERA